MVSTIDCGSVSPSSILGTHPMRRYASGSKQPVCKTGLIEFEGSNPSRRTRRRRGVKSCLNCTPAHPCSTGMSITTPSFDDLIDAWHAGADDRPLHVFLGMTWEEYKIWVTQSG
jgi:hypothetical protein